MERSYVSSSNIESIGYDETTQILEVAFLTGAIYQYYGVPDQLYQGLMSASSKGTYLNQYIKKGGFAYSQV